MGILAPIPLLLSHSVFKVSRNNTPYWEAVTTLVPNGVHDRKYRYATSIAAELWPVIAASRNDSRKFNHTYLFATLWFIV